MVQSIDFTAIREDLEALADATGRGLAETAADVADKLPSWVTRAADDPDAKRLEIVDPVELVHIAVPDDPKLTAAVVIGPPDSSPLRPELSSFDRMDGAPFRYCARHIIAPIGLEHVDECTDRTPAEVMAMAGARRQRAGEQGDGRARLAWDILHGIARESLGIEGEPWPMTRATLEDLRAGALELEGSP